MIKQKELAAVIRTKEKIAQLEEQIRQATENLQVKKRDLEAKVKHAETVLLRRLDEDKESIEAGKHFVRVKESMPRNSISWKSVYKDLWIDAHPGKSFQNEEDRLKAENAKGMVPVKSLVIV